MTPPDPLPSLDPALSARYRIEGEVGRGGMATVYLAHDTRHDRPVALKVLNPALAASLGTERFLLEIRVTARLQHAHILPLLDSGMLETSPGILSPFYVMPYAEGESLRDRLRREVQLPVADALGIAADVAAALAYAHAHGVIHRDVKPENILLSHGDALVVDFGIARALSLAADERLTETGLALGTPHYMSPEQATGDRDVDARSDVYALGCVLYEMLAGEPPFTGPTAQAVAARSLVEPAPPIRKVRPAVSEEVERVIARALAKVPADRFAGAADMGDALVRAAAAPPPASPPLSAARGRRVLVPVAVALVLAVAAGVLVSRPERAPGIIAPAASIAVLPFTPSGPDTALSRLGRDLVFTLSAELDGLGGLRVVDAHTVLARTIAEAPAAVDPASLARSFGAASIVQGSLVRVGAGVRLDLALLGADSAAPLARATVTAPADSVAVLTDSAARAILVQIWSRGSPPTPSLDAALRTRSVPALRAFLQGEGQITHGDWEHAAVSYQRAMEADPAFWLAYARHLYARHWSLAEPADSVVALLARHRLRAAATGAADHRRDPPLGSGQRAPSHRAGTRRGGAVPRFLVRLADVRRPGAAQRPGARTPSRRGAHRPRASGRAQPKPDPRLGAPDDRCAPGRRHGRGRPLARGPDPPRRGADPHRGRLRRPAAAVPLPARDPAGRQPARRHARRQRRPRPRAGRARRRELLRCVSLRLVRRADPGKPPGTRRGRGSRTAAGAPVAARAVLGRTGRMGFRAGEPGPVGGRRRRLERGASGHTAWRRWAPGSARSIPARPPPGARRRSPGRAAAPPGAPSWHGSMACWRRRRRDRRALAETRAALRRSGDPGRDALDRSLGALDAALRGATREAGAAMAALEWEQAALNAPDFMNHPLVVPLDRLAGARWLAASGDTEQAQRLLGWADGAILLHPSTPYTLMVAGLADLERGRNEERLGHGATAAGYYREFLRRYDRPVRGHLPLVEEARVRLRELGGGDGMTSTDLTESP